MATSMILPVLMLLVTGVLLAGFGLGTWWGGRDRQQGREDALLAVAESSSLALMGLLLAFAFAGAANRFIERQDLIVAEANAISTTYLRVELLPDETAQELKQLLEVYTQNRIELYAATNASVQEEVASEAVRLQQQMWQLVIAEMQVNSDHEEVVLPPLNDLFDLHTTRLDAIHRHLQPEVLVALVLGITVSMLFLGYANGSKVGGRSLAAGFLLALLVMVLWVTVDLDYPRYGFIRANPAPLEQLLQFMQGG